MLVNSCNEKNISNLDCNTFFISCRRAVAFETREVDVRPARRETDLGIFFRRDAWRGSLATESFIEWRHDAPHGAGQTLVEAGLRVRLSL